MYFQRRCYVRHWGVDEANEFPRIESVTVPRVALSMRRLRPDEFGDFADKDDWLAELSTEETVSTRVEAQFVAALSMAEKPSEAVLQIVTKVSERMDGFLTLVLRLALWRAGMHGHHELIRQGTGVVWSSDQREWKPARPKVSMVMAADVRSVTNVEEFLGDVKQLVQQEEQAPVAHEILREAWNLASRSPRSALMLGMAAVEVGVKAFITLLVPESEWLCFEVPTPPIVRVLREYLPKLPVRRRIDGKAFIPDDMLETLKKATEKRNRAAHRGVVVEHDQWLIELLNTIQRILFLLDYYAGHDWSLKNVRDANFEPMFHSAHGGVQELDT